MSDKLKKRVRAFAREHGVSYQAAWNWLKAKERGEDLTGGPIGGRILGPPEEEKP